MQSDMRPREEIGISTTAFSTTRSTSLTFMVSLFVCLFVGFCPTRESVTHMERSPKPATNTRGLWAVKVL